MPITDLLKEFNKFTVSITTDRMSIQGRAGIQLVDVPDSAISIAVGKYFFKNKSETFLFRSLVCNAANRALLTYFKKLTMKGIGFKCYKVASDIMLMKVGYTHKIYYINTYEDVDFFCKKGRLIIYGNNSDTVNNFAYQIKKFRQPDSYKGKGIIFIDEKLKLKSSKKRI